MGACASKFPLPKNIAKAPPPATKEVNLEEEVTVGKSDVPADDESKPQSLGHLLKEKEGEKGTAESNAEAYGNHKSSEPVSDAPARNDSQKAACSLDGKNVEMEAKREEGNADEICDADKKPESQKNEGQKPTANLEKKEEKLAETMEHETVEIDTEKKEEKVAETAEIDTEKNKEEKPIEVIKIKTSVETPEIEKIEEQIPASDSGEKKTEVKPVDTVKIETSDKHVLESPKTEKPSDNKPDEVSVEKRETPETSCKEKPKAEEGKTEK